VAQSPPPMTLPARALATRAGWPPSRSSSIDSRPDQLGGCSRWRSRPPSGSRSVKVARLRFSATCPWPRHTARRSLAGSPRAGWRCPSLVASVPSGSRYPRSQGWAAR
jgi:hypothetical protein